MKVLDLFSGSGSLANAAKGLGMTTFSSDIQQHGYIDYVVDILEFDYDKVPFVPDIIWASPPCTGFSVASIGHHWGGGHRAYQPKTETAVLGIRLVQKTREIIAHYEALNPNLIWYIENPRGVLRKLPVMAGCPHHHTVTYCQYGDERMKPTDIWTNNQNWIPRSKCRNGMDCHVAAPRGSKTGTQGRRGAYNRSKVPNELCKEVLTNIVVDTTHTLR